MVKQMDNDGVANGIPFRSTDPGNRTTTLSLELAAEFQKRGINHFAFSFCDPDSDETGIVTGPDAEEALDHAINILQAARDRMEEEGLDMPPPAA